MGRLGFNLAHPKDETNKNVEAAECDRGVNETNEHVEIGDLMVTIEERNRQIASWRLVSSLLAIGILILSSYILLIQSQAMDDDETVVAEAEKMVMDYKDSVEALKESYEEQLRALRANLERNCSLSVKSSRAELQRNLKIQAALAEQGADESRRHYEKLRAEHETLAVENRGRQEVQEELKQELRKLGDERADLERKLAEASRQLERHAAVSLMLQAKTNPTDTTTPTPTTTTTTTTARPTTTTRTPSRGIFDSDNFRRINDFMKEIESGAAMFNKEFTKRIEEMFPL